MGEHVISTVSREFGVDINIVLANVEVIEDNPLGGMVALLGGGESRWPLRSLPGIKPCVYGGHCRWKHLKR